MTIKDTTIGPVPTKRTPYSDLLFGVRRSIRYHLRRRRFFDRFNQTCKFLSALFGTATISTALSQAGSGILISFAALVTIFSVLDLVVGSAQAARLHEDFVRKFVDLEREIHLTESNNMERVLELTNQRLSIEQDEPPILRILDLICHNEVCRAFGYDERYQVKITWYQRVLCHFLDLGEQSITPPTCA